MTHESISALFQLFLLSESVHLFFVLEFLAMSNLAQNRHKEGNAHHFLETTFYLVRAHCLSKIV